MAKTGIGFLELQTGGRKKKGFLRAYLVLFPDENNTAY